MNIDTTMRDMSLRRRRTLLSNNILTIYTYGPDHGLWICVLTSAQVDLFTFKCQVRVRNRMWGQSRKWFGTIPVPEDERTKLPFPSCRPSCLLQSQDLWLAGCQHLG
jgi:hypothetical protein